MRIFNWFRVSLEGPWRKTQLCNLKGQTAGSYLSSIPAQKDFYARNACRILNNFLIWRYSDALRLRWRFVGHHYKHGYQCVNCTAVFRWYDQREQQAPLRSPSPRSRHLEYSWWWCWRHHGPRAPIHMLVQTVAMCPEVEGEKSQTFAVGALVKLRRIGSLSVYLAGSSGTSLGISVNLAKNVLPSPALYYKIW